jgi:hypothetical protein
MLLLALLESGPQAAPRPPAAIFAAGSPQYPLSVVTTEQSLGAGEAHNPLRSDAVARM